MAYSTDVLATAGLQSYWKLDETGATTTAADSGPGARSGTIQAGVTKGQPSLVTEAGTSMTFALAANSSISFGDIYDFANNAAFTIELWVKVTGANQQLIGKKDAGGGWFVGINAASSPYMMRHSGASSNILQGSTALSVGQTYHLAYTYDGGTMRMYVNGVQDATTLASGVAVPDTTDPLLINMRNSYGTGTNATIDNVAIYNVAVPAATLLAHNNSGRAAVGTTHLGAASLSGQSGTTVIANVVSPVVTASLSGGSGLVAGADVYRIGNATLSGDSTATIAGAVDRLASATLTGDSNLSLSVIVPVVGTANLSGQSTVAATANTAINSASASLSGQSNISKALALVPNRFYLSSANFTDVTPTTTIPTPALRRYPLVPKLHSGSPAIGLGGQISTPGTVLVGQWVSPPMASGIVFDPSDLVHGFVVGYRSAGQLTFRAKVSVWNQAGTTLRTVVFDDSTLATTGDQKGFSYTSDDLTLFTDSPPYSNDPFRANATPDQLYWAHLENASAYTTAAGDRLVFELILASPDSGTTLSGTANVGDAYGVPDIPWETGATRVASGAGVPWIEFYLTHGKNISFLPQFPIGTTTLSGQSGVTVSGYTFFFSGAALSGESSVAAAGVVERSGSAVLDGQTDATSRGGILLATGAALAAGDSSLVATALNETRAISALSGQSTASTLATSIFAASAALTGASGVIAQAGVERSATAALAGDSSAVVNGGRVNNGTATFTGDSGLVSAGVRTAIGASVLNAQSDVSAAAFRTATGIASVSGQSSLAATFNAIRNAAATASGQSNLTANGGTSVTFPINTNLLDDFNRVDSPRGTPGGNWGPGQVQTTSNTTLGIYNGTLVGSAGYLNANFGDRQEFYFTYLLSSEAGATRGSQFDIYFRANNVGTGGGTGASTNWSGYQLSISSGLPWTLSYRANGGSTNNIASFAGITTYPAPGTRIGVRAQNVGPTDVQVAIFRDTGSGWQEVGTVTHANGQGLVGSTGGKFGIAKGFYDAIDNLYGGTFTAPPILGAVQPLFGDSGVISLGTRVLQVQAAASGQSNVVTAGNYVAAGKANLSAASALAIDAQIQRTDAADLTSTSGLSVSGGVELGGAASLSGDSAIDLHVADFVAGQSFVFGDSQLVIAVDLTKLAASGMAGGSTLVADADIDHLILLKPTVGFFDDLREGGYAMTVGRRSPLSSGRLTLNRRGRIE